MKLTIDRIDQHALTEFINRVKLIDSFIYIIAGTKVGPNHAGAIWRKHNGTQVLLATRS